jgi:hypothetical protein
MTSPTPPPGHPLPTTWTPGGWVWCPEADDYVPQETQQETPERLLLSPANDIIEVI